VVALGDLFGKGLLGSNPTLVYFIVGYGVLEVIDSHMDLEEFKSFGSFGGLGYVNALATTTHTCFQDIPSTLLVHPLFHSFWGGVEMFVYMMTKKLLNIRPLSNFLTLLIFHKFIHCSILQVHPSSNFHIFIYFPKTKDGI
jgi:hypothetical protein